VSDPLTGVLDLLTRDFPEEKRPDTYSVPEICVIGAGSSGVTVAKALHQRGVAFDCFEKGSDIGGMWRYENDTAYRRPMRASISIPAVTIWDIRISRFRRACLIFCRMRSF
jgi:cation diffusion facilitator CzcD-associated flavoprotein CzcO